MAVREQGTAMVIGCYLLLVGYNAEHAGDGQLA